MMKILIADDEAQLRSLLEDIISITSPNAQVTLVNNSIDLEQKAYETPQNLILTDNKMEKENAGLNAIKNMRKNNITCPIYLLTSDVGDIKNLAKEAGATGYVKKPYSIREISSILKQYTK